MTVASCDFSASEASALHMGAPSPNVTPLPRASCQLLEYQVLTASNEGDTFIHSKIYIIRPSTAYNGLWVDEVEEEVEEELGLAVGLVEGRGPWKEGVGRL